MPLDALARSPLHPDEREQSESRCKRITHQFPHAHAAHTPLPLPQIGLLTRVMLKGYLLTAETLRLLLASVSSGLRCRERDTFFGFVPLLRQYVPQIHDRRGLLSAARQNFNSHEFRLW